MRSNRAVEIGEVLETALQSQVRHLELLVRQKRTGPPDAKFVDILRQRLARAEFEESAEGATAQVRFRSHSGPVERFGEARVNEGQHPLDPVLVAA